MEIILSSSTRRFYRRRLFFYILAIVLFGAVCAAGLTVVLFPSALGTRYGDAIATLRDIDRALFPRAAGLFAVLTGLLVLAVALLNLFYSHSIVGPAFRIGREADRIGGGDLKADFKLRRKDNLTDLAAALKHAARKYRDAVTALEQHAARLEQQTGSLAEAKRSMSDSALTTTLRDMTEDVKAAEKLLSEIRT